jgi:hypothetical protein
LAVFSKRDIYKPSKPKQNNKVKRVFVDLNDLSEGGNNSKGVQIGVRRPFIVFDEISVSVFLATLMRNPMRRIQINLSLPYQLKFR